VLVIPLRVVTTEGSDLERAAAEARTAMAALMAITAPSASVPLAQLAAASQRVHETAAHLTTLAFAAVSAAARAPDSRR
jgi:hypothetical protein